MESCYWCSTCSKMYEKSKEHGDHDVKKVGGTDIMQTLEALDQIIEYGLKALEVREKETENATQVKEDIDEIRNKFIRNSLARIERIVKDIRTAMENSSGDLLKEVNKKVGDMELKCQSVITTSRAKLESIKGLIKEAALAFPNEETGALDKRQLGKLYAYFNSVDKMEAQPRPRIKYVDLNIKYPDSYQRKKECQALANSISGHVENPQRKSFLHDPLPADIEDILMPLEKPKRHESRDALKN